MHCSLREAKPRFRQMMSTFLVCFLIGSLVSGVNGVLVKVRVDRPAILPCIVTNQGDHTVRWFKNPNTLISISLHVISTFTKRMRVIQPYDGEWNLNIDHIQLGDAGDYTCRVGNEVMEQVDLVVEIPPLIHDTHDMTFNEGDTGTVWCNATGVPIPTVSWFWKSPHQKDGIGEDSGAEGNRLVLHNITRYYDNIYSCLALNTVGEESREIRIHVNFGPEVAVFQNTVNATLGQEVTLHCAVAAFPMDGELEWAFKNSSTPVRADWKYEVVTNRELIEDYNTLFVSMTIRKDQLGDMDYGQYVCRTKNFRRGYNDKVIFIQKPKEDKDNEGDITRYDV